MRTDWGNVLILPTRDWGAGYSPAIPTWFMKQNVNVFVPVITDIINRSLSSGIFPDALKHAIITPLIKKQSLNISELKNYRPVSNIPYLSKIIEKFAINNINRYIEVNGLGEELQSAYKPKHSTETALYKVKDDILKSICQHKGVYLVLLDLSSVFDIVHHEMLLKRLVDVIGVRGNVLKWVQSYLSGRTTIMCIDGVLSDPSETEFELPQGSIVGPSMFSIYTIPLGDIIRQFGISFHMYNDDIQLYISFNPKDQSSTVAALDQISQCIKQSKSGWIITC